MAQLNPYLNFNGNCREAVNFYQKAFGGGNLELMTVLLVKSCTRRCKRAA